MVDYTASIKKPFLDIKSFLIGVALSILPIVNWLSLGYALECTGLTKRKVPLNKSPDWADWGKLFVNGFLTFVISIIYFIPALIIFLIALASVLGAILRVVSFTDLITGNSAAISQNIASIMPSLASALPFIFIGIVLALLAAYVVQSAVLNFLVYNRFGKAFSFGEVFKRAFNGTYFVAWIIALIISIVASLIFSWIPVVGSALMFFITSVITYTIFGQVYRELGKVKQK